MEVFIPDPGNPEESLIQFQGLLNQTLETDKDNVHWLLDLNSFQSEDVILDVLKRFVKGAKYLQSMYFFFFIFILSSNLAFDSNLYGFKKNGSSSIDIIEFYSLGPGLPIIQQPITTWSPASGFLQTPEDIWLRRNDLQVSKKTYNH